MDKTTSKYRKNCICCVQAKASKHETHRKHDHTNAATGLWQQAGERTSCYPWRLHVGKMGWTCNARQSKVIHTSCQQMGNLNYWEITTILFMEPQLFSPILHHFIYYKTQVNVCHLNLIVYIYNYTKSVVPFKFEIFIVVLS